MLTFLCLVDNCDELEEMRVEEEYKLWKKHVPYLYDTLYSHATVWPALTIEWMPTKDL